MYQEKSAAELKQILTELQSDYSKVCERGLKLDMSRGKPSPAQLDLSMGVLDALNSSSELISENGGDCRNYGDVDGIPEAKRLMAAIMEVDPAGEVFVGGGSSLNLMHDLITFCYLHALPGCEQPWAGQDEIKFLCPSPGYDRHFNVSLHFGMTLVTVPMTESGPDMDVVERLVKEDASIKGMWCVPKYSNPTGITYSDETVRRIAALRPAAKDFRVFWDNAYAIHDLYEDNRDTLLPLQAELEKVGNDDLAFQFCSFAKVTFGGGGIAAVGASQANIAWVKKHMSLQMINADKVNQLRHARYFGGIDGLRVHMKKHAAMLAPKFEAVDAILAREFGGLGIASWTKPLGGYFISLDVPDGCAKRTVELCKQAGVVMTPAGATYPHGVDPNDRNIRIAPSYPGTEELEQAAELLCLCTKIAAVERLLA